MPGTMVVMCAICGSMGGGEKACLLFVNQRSSGSPAVLSGIIHIQSQSMFSKSIFHHKAHFLSAVDALLRMCTD